MSGLPPLGRFPGVPAGALTREQAELVEAFIDRSGAIPGPYKIWIGNASLAARLKALSDHVVRAGQLSQRETEIAILVMAQATKAAFVEAAHRRIGAEVGLPKTAIDAICAGNDPCLPDGREQIVYEAARAMHEDRPAPRNLFDRAVAALGHDGLTELSALLGFYCACAFTLSFYAVDPPAASAG